MQKPVRTATSSTLYPKNSFIQTARYRRSSLDGRGIFDSGRSLQVEFILLNISHTTFRHRRECSYSSFGQPFPKQLHIQRNNKTAKGVKKIVIKKFIQLFNNKQMYHKMKRIRSDHHQLAKVSLSCGFDDKRFIHVNCIISYAYGHYDCSI